MTIRDGVQQHKGAILTEIDVVEIREKYWKENWTQGALARLKRVSVTTIGKIVRGESWQHISTKTEPAAVEPPSQEIEIQASLARLAGMMKGGQNGNPGDDSSVERGEGTISADDTSRTESPQK